MLQKEIKESVLEAYFLTKETSSWFLLIESLKMIYARSYACGSWGFESFFVACLTKTQQNDCDMSKVSKKNQIGWILTFPKLVK